MKKFPFTLALLLAFAVSGSAQYITSGKIEYEKKVSLHAMMKDYDDGSGNSWYDRVKSQIPQFSYYYFDLTFDTGRTMYKPGREVENKGARMWGESPAAENIVLTNLATNRVTAQKEVFEKKFTVQDTIRKLDWKVKDELRIIGNFKCRKAVSRICDSVYVVAFYTEDIIAGGGPEMFGGLPGMILELAIPRLHTTWTATKVDIIPTKDADFAITDKAKKTVTNKELNETVQSSLKDWGKWAARNLWWIAL
jgi:GLPGLI family protein